MDPGTPHALFACPNCGGRALGAVSDGEDTNFLCLRCGHCWHVELGFVQRVDPRACPGCPGRPLCTAALTSAATEATDAGSDAARADAVPNGGPAPALRP